MLFIIKLSVNISMYVEEIVGGLNNMIIKVLSAYMLVTATIILIYGLMMLSVGVVKKLSRGSCNGNYLFQLWGLVIVLIIYSLYPSNINFFQTENIFTWNTLFLIIMSVIPTSLIVMYREGTNPLKPFSIKHFLDGASMEIPQRLLSQNLLIIFCENIFKFKALPLMVILNGFIWVQFILIQEIIIYRKISIKIMPDIISSFWFSIWIGIFYMYTGNIIIVMLTHGLERYTAYSLRVNMVSKVSR